MNSTPDHHVKLCYRCDAPVRMTREEFAASPDRHTCCAVCRAKLTAAAALLPTSEFPKNPKNQ